MESSAVPDPSSSASGAPSLVERLRAAGCVFAEDEARILLATAANTGDLERMLNRRISGEPLEQVVGWAEFCGLRIELAPGVFVPRRRTQLLVREARRHLDRRKSATGSAVVVELCCGSGAVSRAVADGRALRLVATDVDAAAVACAARNLAVVGGETRLGDLYDAIPADLRGRVDLLLANAPYVPTSAIATMPPEARLFEPRVALDGGDDGVDVHRRIAAQAASWLAPGGALLIETSGAQAGSTADAMARGGLETIVVRDDDVDGTVVIGRRPGRPVRRRAV